MKKLIILFVAILMAMGVSAQDFFKQYLAFDGGANLAFEHVEYDTAKHVYYAVGSSGNFAAIYKIDLGGNVLCSSTYGTGQTAASFFDFVFTADGDLIVVGTSATDTVNNIIVYRVNSSLELEWDNSVNNILSDTSASRVVRPRIAATNNSFIINFLSDVSNNGAGLSDKLSMIAIDGQGAVQWTNQFGTTLDNGNPIPDDQIYDLIFPNIGNGLLITIVGNVTNTGNRNAYVANLTSFSGTISNGGTQFQYPISNLNVGSRFHEIKNFGDDYLVCGSSINNSTNGNGIIGLLSSGTIYRNTISTTTFSSFIFFAANDSINTIIATTNSNPDGNAEFYVFDVDGQTLSYQSSFEILGYNLPANFKLTPAEENKIILYGSQGNNAFLTVLQPIGFTPNCGIDSTSRDFTSTIIGFSDLANDSNFPLAIDSGQDAHNDCQIVADANICLCDCADAPPIPQASKSPTKENALDNNTLAPGTENRLIEENDRQNHKPSFIVSPNPSSGQFEVRWEKEHGGTELNIYDTTGSLIQRIPLRKNEMTTRINLGDVPDGLYVIQAKSGNENLGSQKVYISNR